MYQKNFQDLIKAFNKLNESFNQLNQSTSLMGTMGTTLTDVIKNPEFSKVVEAIADNFESKNGKEKIEIEA